MSDPRSFKVFRTVVLIVLAIFVLVPLYVMLSSAVKPLGEVQGDFHWWPTKATFAPFAQMWHTVPLARYFANSLIVCVIATLFSVLIAIFAGYAVSRYSFRGRRIFTGTVLSTQMFPGILFLLPLFLIYVNLDKTFGGTVFYQTRFGLIVTYLTFSLPFSIWMLAGYFDGIPKDLDEAAQVDGCRAVGALFRAVLPAARPGVIAVAVYAFMTSWGEVLFASVMTNDTSKTVSIGLANYSTQINVYWNQVMAASLIVSIPVVVGFLLLQRYFVAGLTSGAVK